VTTRHPLSAKVGKLASRLVLYSHLADKHFGTRKFTLKINCPLYWRFHHVQSRCQTQETQYYQPWDLNRVQTGTEHVTRWSVWPTKDKVEVNGMGRNQIASLCSVLTRARCYGEITVNQGRCEDVPIMTYFKALDWNNSALPEAKRA
jgi:hypothetical protein